MREKKITMAQAFALAAMLAVPFGAHATVLFQDTFDRAASNDIDASTDGMSGTAAPMTYFEYDPQIPNEVTVIADNQLNLANGANASSVGLESHNFIDGVILSDGGFSISMEITDSGGKTDVNRWCGFGVGVSGSEMANLGLDVANGHTGPRGRFANEDTSGVADFYVDWSPYPDGVGSVQLFTGNTSSDTAIELTGLDAAEGGTLRADFIPPDFNAGSKVIVDVYFNDTKITRTSFLWNETAENYIALSSRQNGDGMLADNFLVETFVGDPEVLAFSATPQIVNTSGASEFVELTWQAAFLDAGATYTVTADQAVVFPNGDDTGSAANGTIQVDAMVDGTLGDVVFTLVVDNGGTLLTNTTTVLAMYLAPALTSVLFSDSFDRVTGDATNDWSVSASQMGIGGTIAGSLPSSGFWQETLQNKNISYPPLPGSITNWSDSCIIIVSNESEQVCRLTTEYPSAMGLDHNFIDAAILSDGGFSVAMDVTEWFGSQVDSDRYIGFGVGLSLAELMELTNYTEPESARGAISAAVGMMGVSDLWVGISRDEGGMFQVLSEGVLIDEIPLSDEVGRIRIDFGVEDFNAGSFAAYKLYFEELLVGQGFFRWNSDDENYICVSARMSGGIDIDNVTIGTVDLPFTAPADSVDTMASIDLSGGLSNIVISASAVSNVVSRVDMRAGTLLAQNPLEWTVLTEEPTSGGETVLDYETNTNITITVDATSYGWTNSPAEGYFRIKPVGWKIPVN